MYKYAFLDLQGYCISLATYDTEIALNADTVQIDSYEKYLHRLYDREIKMWLDVWEEVGTTRPPLTLEQEVERLINEVNNLREVAIQLTLDK